ncbi:hypothetical protein [Pseudoflavonifractor sp. MCC625]|uniref:hypothetical protein n=1 Tax=Pseudoflavonifractor sp. MCC625 TaxID=2592647 RepID=UPI001C031817|nr:hypothetical protein [Pseudoflavonifractor sp. MCC625]MBT9685178.1 hypothetical protein [Pseudoflavonifractor sp. MCC625]
MDEKKSNASTRAKNKYAAKTYDRIPIQVKKGHKEIISARASSLGKSTNKYICDLIDADLREAGE